LRNRTIGIILAVLAAIAPDVIAIWSISQSANRLSDPGFHWSNGVTSRDRWTHGSVISRNGKRTVRIDGPSESRTSAIVKLLLVPVGIIIASLLALYGTVKGRPAWTMSASTLAFLEAVPLIFSFVWLMILTSGIYIVAARLTGSVRRGIRRWQLALGSLAGVLLLIYTVTTFTHRSTPVPLFLWLLLSSLAFVTAAAWLPISSNPDTAA